MLKTTSNPKITRLLVPCIDPQYEWRGTVYTYQGLLAAMKCVYGDFGLMLFTDDEMLFRGGLPIRARRFNRTRPTYPSRLHVISDEPVEVK